MKIRIIGWAKITAKQVWLEEIEDTKPRRRPRRSLEDNIKRDLKRNNVRGCGIDLFV
jgi:hypothetical protein